MVNLDTLYQQAILASIALASLGAGALFLALAMYARGPLGRVVLLAVATVAFVTGAAAVYLAVRS